MESREKTRTTRLSTVLIGTVIIGLLIGGILGYGVSRLGASGQINDLQSNVSTLQTKAATANSTINSLSSQVKTLQDQVSSLQSAQNTQNTTDENITYVLGGNISLSQLYDQAKNSIVVVEGITVTTYYNFWGQPYYVYGTVQGSGFVYDSAGRFVIITNYHVVQDAVNITVTFTDGDAYAANVIGTDPYEDLAVLSTNASQDEYSSLTIASSLTLRVGDPVVAIGDPLGYTGSMTTGIVSALGRTVTVDWSSYPIADCIQTSAPINPGNSGGPLLNYQGEVVGITSYTATYQGAAAQGLGLAIPSSAILREIGSLIANSSYNLHPSFGASGTDMTYGIAQSMNVNITYGWLITQVTSGGAADKAGLKGGTTQAQVEGSTVTIGGDIITAINGTRIKNTDDLSAYLEEYTVPGQTINVTILRKTQTLTLPVTLGNRPPP
jgi:S1-C subfamily serine protease